MIFFIEIYKSYKAENLCVAGTYSIFPVECTIFLCTVTVHKNTVRLIGNIEYHSNIR